MSNYGDWQPIGNYPAGNEFTGTFINKGKYKIKNLTINSSQNLFKGPFGGCTASLFGSVSNAYIDGIILENVYINTLDFDGGYSSASAAGIASSMLSGVIRNCEVNGSIYGQNYAGGIVGTNSLGLIINCKFNGTVETQKDSLTSSSGECGAGGIAGYSGTGGLGNDGYIKDCTVNANISGHDSSGGIVGINNNLLKRYHYCTFMGSVFGDKYTGDEVGYNRLY